ncbi:hypothetical protein ACKS0A_05500 [Histoplasma ohiense]
MLVLLTPRVCEIAWQLPFYIHTCFANVLDHGSRFTVKEARLCIPVRKIYIAVSSGKDNTVGF